MIPFLKQREFFNILLLSWTFLLWVVDFGPNSPCKTLTFAFISSADVEVEIRCDEVCGLSLWGRKEEEEVLGSFPDSLEPCCNSLIETEWDVLITLVVKTEGGRMGGKGGCALWSLGWGSLRWGGGAPINTAKLTSEETQDFTSFSNLLALSFSLLQTWTDGYFPAAMRGRFSIEWMAQSSQSAESDALPGHVACGTHSESLPGFYCRQKSGKIPEEKRNQGLKTLNQHQSSPSNQGKSRLFCTTQSFKVRFTVDIYTFSR